MFVFIAGASTTGPVNARYSGGKEIVRQAVGELGQTDRPWRARRPGVRYPARHAMCSTALERVASGLAAEKRSVMTLRPVSVAKVSGRTNSCAPRVMTTWTVEAALHQRAGQLRGFVGRDAAADAQDDVHRTPSRHRRYSSDYVVRRQAARARLLARDLVFHQSAPDFFHGDHGGLLGRWWAGRGGAALQLPRALGGDNDEPVGALFRIVRNGAMRVVSEGSVYP